MLLIVAHHYVVNSGLFDVLDKEPLNISSSVMIIFGAWGKTGINCFILITGYFMCRTKFTFDKLLKLYLQILFYTIIIYSIFVISGHEKLTFMNLLWKIWPIHSISSGFTSCFLLFYLFIPFINLLLNNLDQKKHAYLVILIIFGFSILPTVPIIKMTFNYVSWFIVLYIIGSYIRVYGLGNKITHSQWGLLSIVFVLISSCSVLGMTMLYKKGYIPVFNPHFFISDCNKILALLVAVTSFMYFKDLKIPHSRFINAIGGATFGVLLIHANSDAMRTWLWKETVDCTGHFGSSLLWTLGYATVSVLIIFFVCAGIDWFRGKFIEPHLMTWGKNIINKVVQCELIRKKVDNNNPYGER